MYLTVLVAGKDKRSFKSIYEVLMKQAGIDLYLCDAGFMASVKVLSDNHANLAFFDTDLFRSHTEACVKLLSRKFKDLRIVLVSNTSGFLDVAFDIAAAGYIIKPFCTKDVLRCVDRVKRSMDYFKFTGLMIHSHGKEILIKYDEIFCIEANSRKCIIYTDQHEYEVYRCIKNISDQLPGNIFFKSHRSFIINASKIKSIELFNKTSYNVILQNDRIALLSKKKFKILKSRYNNSFVT